jgi:hypothetical protein
LGALSELALEDARLVTAQAMTEALKFGTPTVVTPKRESSCQSFPWMATQTVLLPSSRWR